MPAPSDPYISWGVHIIPDCEDHDTVFNAFHTIQSDHPLYWKRHNEPLPGFNRAGCFHRPLDSHIIHLIDYACDCYIARAGERKLRLLAQLLFHEIYDLVNPEPETAGNYPEPFLRILQRIEDNLEMPLTLKELVRNGKYSISGLNRLFNKYMNTSPQRYIARRRMHHAAMVLRKSSKSIAALAQSLQFSTEGNFSRAFTREFGVPPRQYRQNPPQTSYAPDIYRPPTQKNSGMKTLFVPKFIPDSINPATGEEK
jgi:AraC-like DNA-binding protein